MCTSAGTQLLTTVSALFGLLSICYLISKRVGLYWGKPERAPRGHYVYCHCLRACMNESSHGGWERVHSGI